MLSLIRGGEKAASHNLGLQSEQKKERTWGQEVTVLPPPAQSCQGYSRNIVMWGERGEAKLASLYVHYTYTLKQLTLAKLQGIFGGVMKAPIVAPVAILWRRRWTPSLFV